MPSEPSPPILRPGIDDVPRTDESGNVDLSLIEYCLSLTPAQRLERFGDYHGFILSMRRGECPRGRIRDLLKCLTDHGVEFVIAGDVAASLYGGPIGTMLLQLVTPFTNAAVSDVLAAFGDIRPRLRTRADAASLLSSAPERLLCLKSLCLLTDLGPLDLLSGLPGVGAYEELIGRTVIMDVGGFACRVVDLESLIAAHGAAGHDRGHVVLRRLQAITRLREKNRRFHAS